MHVVVIGSGPSGVAAAHALLARGVEVTVVDGGEVLEPHRAAQVDALRAMAPPWTTLQLDGLRGNLSASRRGIAQKRAFGLGRIDAPHAHRRCARRGPAARRCRSWSALCANSR